MLLLTINLIFNFDDEFDDQATLIIRHPTTTRLFVNFDREILQLIRETKLLQRSNVRQRVLY